MTESVRQSGTAKWLIERKIVRQDLDLTVHNLIMPHDANSDASACNLNIKKCLFFPSTNSHTEYASLILHVKPN